MPTSSTIPPIVTDIVTTMQGTVDPITGWPSTICGTYAIIADTVNIARGTLYSAAEIGNALTWLHENGPAIVGATITKAGPGNRGEQDIKITADWDPKTLTWNPCSPRVVTVDGNVYMLIVDGREMHASQRRIMAEGQIRWCDYRSASLRNDVIDLSMYRGTLSPSAPAARKARRQLNASIASLANEISVLQTLKSTLEALV